MREVSREMAALHKEFYGKGPDHVKAYVHDDTILVLMRGGFTQVEETLLQDGESEAVIIQRMAFQKAMRPRYEEIIKRLTGHSVVAFISGNHQDPDVMAEMFVLDSTDLFEDPK